MSTYSRNRGSDGQQEILRNPSLDRDSAFPCDPVLCVEYFGVPWLVYRQDFVPVLKTKGYAIFIQTGTITQADWDCSDSTSPAYIKNKPDISSIVWQED